MDINVNDSGVELKLTIEQAQALFWSLDPYNDMAGSQLSRGGAARVVELGTQIENELGAALDDAGYPAESWQ